MFLRVWINVLNTKLINYVVKIYDGFLIPCLRQAKNLCGHDDGVCVYTVYMCLYVRM